MSVADPGIRWYKKCTMPRPKRDAQILVSAIRELSQARSLEEVQAIVRRAARQALGADGATFVLRDGDHCAYVDEDAIAPLWKGQRFPMSACISGWVMIHRRAAAIEDIYRDPRIPADAYRPTFVKSLAMMPIRQQAPIGAIGVYWAKRHVTSPSELELLQALADSTSVAMDGVRAPRPSSVRRRRRPGAAARRCQNLYAFIRHRVGSEVSDRELARRWGMSWRSFVNLKEGARRVPRVEELEALADMLGIDALIVFLVARGEPASVVNHWLVSGASTVRRELLARVAPTETAREKTALMSDLERVPGAVFTIDMKGRIEDLNARLVSLLGVQQRSIAGRPLSDFVSSESAATLLVLQTDSLQRGGAGPQKLALENGCVVALSMAPIDGANGQKLGFQCLAQPALEG